MAVQASIRKFLMENFLALNPESQLDDHTSLLDAGVIDSTGILELVAFVEESFGFSVSDDEILPENFDSIDKIADYVQRKVAGAPTR